MLMVGEQERRDRFGYALREALRKRGMSERQLAQRMEIDPRQVARWRTGKGLPDIYQTQALIAVLRVKEDLFRNPPPVPEPPAYPIEDYLLEAVDRGVAQGLSDGPPAAPVDGELAERQQLPRR